MNTLKQRYGYWVSTTYSTYVEVVAPDNDEAEEMLWDMLSNGEIDTLEGESETSIDFDKVERLSEDCENANQTP